MNIRLQLQAFRFQVQLFQPNCGVWALYLNKGRFARVSTLRQCILFKQPLCYLCFHDLFLLRVGHIDFKVVDDQQQVSFLAVVQLFDCLVSKEMFLIKLHGYAYKEMQAPKATK